jgi:hypothetical protein
MDGSTRPKCDPKWSQQIRTLLERGWGIPEDRPSMDDIIDVLRCELNCYTTSTSQRRDTNDLDVSRKSDASLLAIK